MRGKLKSLFILPFLLLLGGVVHATPVTVTYTLDDDPAGDCSLRQAIQVANGLFPQGTCPNGIDSITLLAGNYILTQDDLVIDANLTITGAGSGQTTITQQSADRVILIVEDNNLQVAMTGLTITGGNATGDGGGIDILETNTVTLTDVHVNVNTASGDGAGINNRGTLLTLNNCQVNGNTSGQNGGGINNFRQTEIIIGPAKGLTFGKFDVADPNLQLSIQNTTISGNHADTGSGGGIANQGLDITIDSSTISINNAYEGGGLAQAPFGAPAALITNSTISGNTAVEFQATGETSDGGGIINGFGDPLTLVNTTVSGNSADNNGGGIVLINGACNIIAAPAIKFLTPVGPVVHFDNVTIANNNAKNGSGGGIFEEIPICSTAIKFGTTGNVSAADMQNSIVADNTTTSLGPDCSGQFLSLGFNLIGNSGDCIGFDTSTNDILDQPSGLGALQDNGGPTSTQGLLAGSLAIDSANPAGCVDQNGQVLNRDQRGFARPVDATNQGTAICDRGAFEVGSSDITVTKVDDTGGQANLGDQFNYIMTVTNNGPSPALNTLLSDPVPSQFTVTDPITTTAGTCSHSGNQVNCQLGDIDVNAVVTITVPVIAVSAQESIVNTVTVTTSTDGFQVAQTKQASTTTSIGGNNLAVSGSGCKSSLIPSGNGSPWGMLLVLLAALGVQATLRIRRVKG